MTDIPQLSKLGRAAVAYAGLGWRVFTLRPKSKHPLALCSSVGADGTVCDARLPARDKATHECVCAACGTVYGKEDKAGLYLATTDIETVTRWWLKEPKANIGIRCGAGLLVVDIDVPNADVDGKTADGEASLALLEAENEDFPVTPMQRTGESRQADGSMRRGRQFVFKVEGEVRNSASKLGAGIDTRGDGGYIVAAPSIHPSGIAYEWDAERRPSKTPLAPAPAWLLEKLQEPKHLTEVERQPVARPRVVESGGGNKWVESALDGEYQRAAAQTPGSRNSNLNTAAFKLGQLIGGGLLEESRARHTLEAAAEASGWAAEEGPDAVAKVIASGLSAGALKPRTAPERPEPQTRAAAPQGGQAARLRVVGGSAQPAVIEQEAAKPQHRPVARTGWTIENWADHVIFKPETRMLAPKVIVNAVACLLYRAEFVDLFRYNVRTQTIIITRQPPWSENGGPYPREMSDDDVTGFRMKMEQDALGLRLGAKDCHQAIVRAARERHFDPALESLLGFVWDGVERLDYWLVTYLGAKDDSFVRQAGAKWMIAAAKRVIHPGCKFDYMLVLEGDQGTMKSTALRTIAEALSPDAFSDRISPITSKDSMIELLGTVIVEAAEMVAFKGADTDETKRFLSAQDDKLRLPWDRTTSRLPRGCVFAGTLNPDGAGWHEDPTGGRRFWPVEVKKVDIERLRQDAPQLWAEARARMETGEAVWFEDEVILQMAQDAMAMRTIEDAWSEKIDRYLHDKDKVSIPEVLTEALAIDSGRLERRHVLRVAGHLTRRKWRKITPKDADGKTRRMWGRPKAETPATLFAGEGEDDE